MTVDLAVVGGTLATADGTVEAGLAVDDGRIAAIGRERDLPAADRTVDVDGRVVMPGVVDPHVHIDGFNSIDSYETGTAAAALGGVTSVINFAWQTWTGEREKRAEGSVWADTGSLRDAVARQRAKASDALVDYGLHATVTADDRSVFDEFAELAELGVTSVKFFTAYDIGLSNGFLRLAFERLAAEDLVALVHTEDAAVCEALTERQRERGAGDPTDYPAARPDYAEAMALADAVTVARETGCKYYGVHTSSAAAAAELDDAREDGSLIRGETCPHYLALTDAAYAEQGARALQSPPLRSAADADALFDALADGALSTVGTDHVASTAAEKAVDEWWDCPFGVNSLQTSLPVMHDEAVVERGWPLSSLVRLMCRNPAETFGLPRKGRLEVGADADFVVFDPTATHRVDAADNASRADYSVYDGREVTGRVAETWVRGERVAADGEVVADPGHGAYLHREIPDWESRGGRA
ncbi:dihydroorotase [Halosimplex pelagicum]|uniref:Amidohydrolase family protein n=1 Tax=Halosimplex pelagicum TaxID=869886 RepID=A0A7D5PDW9_9EURY|nr:amidohydrolase family protein [Halosimplex pelagicum]QLH84522.1 amidohydrolase family protein [Halosimplex pelagicum]